MDTGNPNIPVTILLDLRTSFPQMDFQPIDGLQKGHLTEIVFYYYTILLMKTISVLQILYVNRIQTTHIQREV